MAPLQQWHEYILFKNSAEPTECWTWYYIIHNFRRLHIIIIIMIAISTCAVCLCKQPVFGIDASRRHRWCRDFPSLHQPYAVIFQLHFDKIGTRYEYDGVRHTLREAKLLCCAHSAVKMPSSTLGMDACLSLSGCMWVSKRFVACAFCVSLYKLRWIYITNVTVWLGGRIGILASNRCFCSCCALEQKTYGASHCIVFAVRLSNDKLWWLPCILLHIICNASHIVFGEEPSPPSRQTSHSRKTCRAPRHVSLISSI